MLWQKQIHMGSRENTLADMGEESPKNAPSKGLVYADFCCHPYTELMTKQTHLRV